MLSNFSKNFQSSYDFHMNYLNNAIVFDSTFKPTVRDSSSKIGIIGDGIISEDKDGSYDTINEIFIDVPGLSSP